MTDNDDTWDIQHLRGHLQAAVQLEYWTVPYYMAAMYSIKDPTHQAYKMMQSVVYQEMLHVQLAANVANAFGATIDRDDVFVDLDYSEQNVPHLRFTEAEKNRYPIDPTQTYKPWGAEIGPLDERRINTMCLIEYPEDDISGAPDLQQETQNYRTIGEFYRAVLFGATQRVDVIVANHNQVDVFKNFYRDFPSQTVTSDGVFGLEQIVNLIHAITDQGEGVRRHSAVPNEYRNTADGYNNDEDHFAKFNDIKNLQTMPETYSGVAHPEEGTAALEAQQRLIRHFSRFRDDMVYLFNGAPSADMWPHMATLGGDILNCWTQGAIPQFSGSVK